MDRDVKWETIGGLDAEKEKAQEGIPTESGHTGPIKRNVHQQ